MEYVIKVVETETGKSFCPQVKIPAQYFDTFMDIVENEQGRLELVDSRPLSQSCFNLSYKTEKEARAVIQKHKKQWVETIKGLPKVSYIKV